MPRRRKPTRRPRARRGALTRRRKRRTYTKLPLTVKTSQLVRMRYAELINLNSGVATNATHSFRANSVFDPSETGFGGQPCSRDEYAAFYKKYTVVGSKLTAVFVPRGATSANAHICAVRLSKTTGVGAAIENPMLEQRNCTWKVTTGYHAGKPTTISRSFSLKKHFQVRTVDDDVYSGDMTTGTNPGEQMFYNVMVASPNPGDDADSIDIVVTVDYIVLLRDPIDLSAS